MSTLGGPRELVEHEVTGLVLPTTDPNLWAGAIGALLDDDQRRTRMSEAAAPGLSSGAPSYAVPLGDRPAGRPRDGRSEKRPAA